MARPGIRLAKALSMVLCSVNNAKSGLMANILFALVLVSCGSKLTVNGQSVSSNLNELERSAAPDSTPPPTPSAQSVLREVPGMLGVPWTYFQSRSVVTVNLRLDELEPGSDLSVLNETTNDPLISNQQLALGLTEVVPEYSLSASAFDVSIRMYPMAEQYRGRFVPGVNLLRVTVDQSFARLTSSEVVKMADFPYFSLSLAAFSEDLQNAYGLQGEVSVFGSNIVGNGQGYLLTGPVNILNR